MNRIQHIALFFLFTALIYSGNLHAQVASGLINGHDYVDLGLSVKWATCNVGANKPSDYGNYYAWGETETKSTYTEENCETWEKQIGNIGYTSRDVAHVKWGGSWRMPTEVEFEELLDENNCDWTWITMNGVNGYKVTSKKLGYKDNYIFLPTAGRHFDGPTPIYSGKNGDYWSSSPYENNACRAVHLYFDGYYICQLKKGRYIGMPVRPVSE